MRLWQFVTFLPKSLGEMRKLVSTSSWEITSLSAIEILVPQRIKFLANSVLTPFAGVMRTLAFNRLFQNFKNISFSRTNVRYSVYRFCTSTPINLYLSYIYNSSLEMSFSPGYCWAFAASGCVYYSAYAEVAWLGSCASIWLIDAINREIFTS